MKFVMTEKAMNAIKERGGNLMIKQNACDYAGSILRLWTEASDRKEDEQEFDKYEHEGITLYIEKKLKLTDTIEIDQRSTLPVYGPTFNISGIILQFL